MIESLCYAVVCAGAVAAVAACAAIGYRAELARLRRERDALVRQVMVLRHALAGGVNSARGVNATLDRLATDLAGELESRGARQ